MNERADNLLTLFEAAPVLRVKVSTLRSWVLHRKIPYIKLLGGRVFLRRSDCEALISASVVPARENPNTRERGHRRSCMS